MEQILDIAVFKANAYCYLTTNSQKKVDIQDKNWQKSIRLSNLVSNLVFTEIEIFRVGRKKNPTFLDQFESYLAPITLKIQSQSGQYGYRREVLRLFLTFFSFECQSLPVLIDAYVKKRHH